MVGPPVSPLPIVLAALALAGGSWLALDALARRALGTPAAWRMARPRIRRLPSPAPLALPAHEEEA